MNALLKHLVRDEPAPAVALDTTRFVLLPGGARLEARQLPSGPRPRRRRLVRGMLQALSTGRRASGRARSPRFGL